MDGGSETDRKGYEEGMEQGMKVVFHTKNVPSRFSHPFCHASSNVGHKSNLSQNLC